MGAFLVSRALSEVTLPRYLVWKNVWLFLFSFEGFWVGLGGISVPLGADAGRLSVCPLRLSYGVVMVRGPSACLSPTKLAVTATIDYQLGNRETTIDERVEHKLHIFTDLHLRGIKTRGIQWIKHALI